MVKIFNRIDRDDKCCSIIHKIFPINDVIISPHIEIKNIITAIKTNLP